MDTIRFLQCLEDNPPVLRDLGAISWAGDERKIANENNYPDLVSNPPSMSPLHPGSEEEEGPLINGSSLFVANPLDFQLHRAVFDNEVETVKRLLDCTDLDINARDNQGNTPLLLAVKMRHLDIARVLIVRGADMKVSSDGRFSILEEAILAKDEEFLQEIYLREQRNEWIRWRPKANALIPLLVELPDFDLEMHWRFGSKNVLAPLIKAVAPNDTYHIWKRGAWLRIDSTIAGYSGRFRVVRGRVSIIFTGPGHKAPGSILKLDHDKKKVYSLLRRLERPTQGELRQACRHLMKASDSGRHADVYTWQPSDLRFDLPAKQRKTPKTVGSWRCHALGHVTGVARLETYRKTRQNFEGMTADEYFGSTPHHDVEATNPHKVICREVKADLWLTKEFPLKLQQLLPLLEFISFNDNTVESLREIMGTTGIDKEGFPVQSTVPLIMGVHAVVKFDKCRLVDAREPVDDGLFGIPPDYSTSKKLFLVSKEEKE
jgi:hypothetical protein